MCEKTITLPNRNEMLRRLLKIDNTPHLQQKFYPLLLEAAGQERVAGGIVMMLVLAIEDYVDGLIPAMRGVMYLHAPHFIDALADDRDVADAAKKFLQEVLSAK